MSDIFSTVELKRARIEGYRDALVAVENQLGVSHWTEEDTIALLKCELKEMEEEVNVQEIREKYPEKPGE